MANIKYLDREFKITDLNSALHNRISELCTEIETQFEGANRLADGSVRVKTTQNARAIRKKRALVIDLLKIAESS